MSQLSGIADNAVTLAKLAHGTANKHLGFDETGAPAETKSFESAEQTITPSGQLVIAHGLGIKPNVLQAHVVCKTVDGPFVVNDTIEVNVCGNDPNSAASRGLIIQADNTNLSIRFGSTVNVFNVFHKTTGAGYTIADGNWKIVFRASV